MQAASIANVKTLFSTIHQQKSTDGYFQFCLPTNLNCFCVTSINKPSQHRSILYYVHFIDTKTQMKRSINMLTNVCVWLVCRIITTHDHPCNLWFLHTDTSHQPQYAANANILIFNTAATASHNHNAATAIPLHIWHYTEWFTFRFTRKAAYAQHMAIQFKL